MFSSKSNELLKHITFLLVVLLLLLLAMPPIV